MNCSPQSPLSVRFSGREYWRRIPPPRVLPYPRIEPTSPVALTIAGSFFTAEPLGKPRFNTLTVKLENFEEQLDKNSDVNLEEKIMR